MSILESIFESTEISNHCVQVAIVCSLFGLLEMGEIGIFILHNCQKNHELPILKFTKINVLLFQCILTILKGLLRFGCVFIYLKKKLGEGFSFIHFLKYIIFPALIILN